MPTIPTARLIITRVDSSARIRIDIDVAWDTFERRAGQEYLLQAEMWGEDGGPFGDPDNRLFVISRTFATDGSVLQRVTVDSLTPVRDLNEDTASQDEIYSVVRLTPVRVFGPASARTNTVTRDFSP